MGPGYFYTLSALLQAFAALVGLVGIVAMFRLQQQERVGRSRMLEKSIAVEVAKSMTLSALVVFACMLFLPMGDHLSHIQRACVVISIFMLAFYALSRVVWTAVLLWFGDQEAKELVRRPWRLLWGWRRG